jgi:predicted Abi (CAAX) family protease
MLCIHRIAIGFSTIPTAIEWIHGFFLLLFYGLIALSFGIWQGFLQWNIHLSRFSVIKITATSLIAPAMLEELFFRVLLLPHPSDLKHVLIWSSVSLFLFVIYHPLNGLTFFPAGKKTFLDPVFLALAALLGLCCTMAYLYTGSVWISLILHWLTVVVWLLCWDGSNKLELRND